MALREDEVWQPKGFQEESDADSIYEDWFWQPLKRHQTVFIESGNDGAVWRESGRRLQIAHRLSSQTFSKQASLAYMYGSSKQRNTFREAANQEKERKKW